MKEDTKQDSGAHVRAVKKWKCLNCKEIFKSYEDAQEHWAKTCPAGTYLAPINGIIKEVRVGIAKGRRTC